MSKINLETHLSQIRGIGPRFLTRLKKLEIETIKDLLWHFPTRYEDFSQIYKIADLQPNQQATVQGIIQEVGGRQTWRRRLFLVEAVISDDSGSVRAVWFNQPYVKNVLQPGRIVNFSGKVIISQDELCFSNPAYEVISDEFESVTKHTGRIVPIYPETKGLTSKGLRYLIKPILGNIPEIPDIIPPKILKDNDLLEINSAIQKIHFPETIEEAMDAKKRFAFEDLFALQLYTAEQKLNIAKQKATPLTKNVQKIKELLEQLPFNLTLSQKKSLWEILQDLQKGNPMNRLLQGDVGSGKTVVVVIAAIAIAQQNNQSAFMAPTEILARQHFQTITKLFPELDFGIALLTSSGAEVFYDQKLKTSLKKPALLKEIATGNIKIIIGTHALIQKGVTFPKLTLVIVDEQHRFGVNQRAALIKNQKIKSLIPHFLSMSATPIPRTLSLTLFGDLDLSLITELPKNRKTIITKIVSPTNRKKAYAFIREQIKKGRQTFVICPRIEPTENISASKQGNQFNKLELKSVKEEYKKLSKKIFPDLNVVMLHGKMKPKEKVKIMEEFSAGKSDILVATSVVEVGVDIPNATIMMIEGADRFGLAQLYQFRGRVGRGEHQSFCFLFTDSAAQSTHRRLKSIVEAKNGFELAEKDLAIRGPGEFLGRSQTGIPDIAMKAIQNPELVTKSRQAALAILKKDGSLKKYPLLREKLKQFQKQVHWE